jgi:hypothetical protein
VRVHRLLLQQLRLFSFLIWPLDLMVVRFGRPSPAAASCASSLPAHPLHNKSTCSGRFSFSSANFTFQATTTDENGLSTLEPNKNVDECFDCDDSFCWTPIWKRRVWDVCQTFQQPFVANINAKSIVRILIGLALNAPPQRWPLYRRLFIGEV